MNKQITEIKTINLTQSQHSKTIIILQVVKEYSHNHDNGDQHYSMELVKEL